PRAASPCASTLSSKARPSGIGVVGRMCTGTLLDGKTNPACATVCVNVGPAGRTGDGAVLVAGTVLVPGGGAGSGGGLFTSATAAGPAWYAAQLWNSAGDT